jgi:hypothetical protein
MTSCRLSSASVNAGEARSRLRIRLRHFDGADSFRYLD